MTKQAPVAGACFLMQRLTVSLFLLMVILLMPHRQPLLHELFAALGIDADAHWVARRHSILTAQRANNCPVKRCFFRLQLASFSACKLFFSVNSESFLLTKHLRKRDLTICPKHLLIAFPAHLLVRLRVDICVRSKDMVADILLDGLLEKQLANAVTEHTEDGFQRFAEDLRQEVSGILTLQIAAVKENGFVNKIVLRRTSVQLVVVLHLAPRRIIQPNGMAAFFLCFYGVHSLQK